MHTFSYSQVRNFLSCRHKWYLDKVEGIKPIEVKRAPTMGSVIHEAIAGRIRGQDTTTIVNDFLKKKREELEPHFSMRPDLAEDLEAISVDIMINVPWVVDAWTKWIDLDSWETVVHPVFGPMVERRMVHADKVAHIDFEFVWIADWVATHKPTGLTWLIDWKARTQFLDDREHEFALQKMVYQYLLDQVDVRVSGSRIAQISPTMPKTPNLNKDGSMSRAACATTWDRYSEALVEAGLNPADYEEMKAKLRSPDTWFQWASAYRTDEECRNAWYRVIMPAVYEMICTRDGEVEPIRNLGSLDCRNMCSYKLVCMETLRGRSMEGLLDFGFEKREAKREEEEENAVSGE